MLSLSETLTLLGLFFDQIAQETETPESVNLVEAYEAFQENPLDPATHAPLIRRFGEWYACQSSATQPVPGATPGPWQLGEREPGDQFDTVKLWGGCLNQPTSRSFVIAWIPLHHSTPGAANACATLSSWTVRNAAILATSLELYQVARALLDSECGSWNDINNAVRLARNAMVKIDATHL